MRESDPIASSEITPLSAYLNRRALIKAGIAAASLATTGLVYRRLNRGDLERSIRPCSRA